MYDNTQAQPKDILDCAEPEPPVGSIDEWLAEQKSSRPHYVFIEKLQNTLLRRQRQLAKAEAKVNYTFDSLRLVIRSSDRALSYLMFRSWRFYKRLDNMRDKMYLFSAEEKRSPKTIEIMSVHFRHWRAVSDNERLSRNLAAEAVKLKNMLDTLRQQLVDRVVDVEHVTQHVRLLTASLEQLQVQGSRMPVKMDQGNYSAFVQMIFQRSTAELAMLKSTENTDMLFLLAPQLLKRSPINVETDSSIDALLSSHAWSHRHTFFATIGKLREQESTEENAAYSSLLSTDPEDLLLQWVNYTLDKGNAVTKHLVDICTDLRDSNIYTAILSILAPELPIEKVSDIADLHSRAQLVLQMGKIVVGSAKRVPTSALDFVSGVPELHLLFLGSLFLSRSGLAAATDDWAQRAGELIVQLKAQWSKMCYTDATPLLTAHSFLARLFHISVYISTEATRRLRRNAGNNQVQKQMKTFLMRMLEVYGPIGPRRAAGRFVPRNTATRNNFCDAGGVVRAIIGSHNSNDSQVYDEQVSMISRIFINNRRELEKIFRFYSRNNIDGLSFTDYLDFANDCQLTASISEVSAESIPMSHIYHIFTVSTITADEFKMFQHSGIPEDLDPEMSGKSMTSPRLYDALIRMANLRYPTKASLVQRLDTLLNVDIMPRASRLSLDSFRRTLAQPEVRVVLQTHEKTLVQVFFRFASNDTSDANDFNCQLMNINEWEQLAQSGRWPCTEEQQLATFRNAQQDEEFGDEDPSLKRQLSYSEFLEAIAATSVHVYPDPFMPLHQKLDCFIQVYLASISS